MSSYTKEDLREIRRLARLVLSFNPKPWPGIGLRAREAKDMAVDLYDRLKRTL